MKYSVGVRMEVENMDSHDQFPSDQLELLSNAFSDQLLACLQECAHGRRGLFSDVALIEDEEMNREWPEALRLRELAQALQNVFAQYEERNPLCDEFLDLCSMHGESHPGEPRLARMFLSRIESGAVGTATEDPRKPW
jgi:hypothetical protein